MGTETEYRRMLRERRKAESKCTRCGKPVDRNGAYCSKCREYMIADKRWYIEHRICPNCRQNPIEGNEKKCPECNAKHSLRTYTEAQKARWYMQFRTRQNAMYKKNSEIGICTRCGKRKAALGRKKCASCLEKDRVIHMRIRKAE